MLEEAFQTTLATIQHWVDDADDRENERMGDEEEEKE